MTAQKILYVVRRDFKAGGRLFIAGHLVDPSEVHLFKIRLHDNLIVKIPFGDEKRMKDLRNFLHLRFGVDLDEVIASEGSDIAEPKEPGASAMPPTTGTPELESETETDITAEIVTGEIIPQADALQTTTSTVRVMPSTVAQVTAE